MDCPKRDLMAGLPDESMLEILARTPFRSICRSKCVAKAWRDLIDDPLNRRRLPQTLQGFFSVYSMMDMFSGVCHFEHCFVKYSASSVPLDIDPRFTFLTKLPEIERLCFPDSCNGLLLFKHLRKSNLSEVLGYIVCNPATKHWVNVPVSPCCLPLPAKATLQPRTYLAFDPAVSPHFHLIQLLRGARGEEASWTSEKIKMLPLSVHIYSSETGVWSHSQSHWNELDQMEGWLRQGSIRYGYDQHIFVNGFLHLIVSDQGQRQIVAVDVQGRTKRTIKMPNAAQQGLTYIGQSQGRLHCIKQNSHVATQAQSQQSYELSIWVLQDDDTQEWVLKDTVSFHRLFGGLTDFRNHGFSIVIHPDRNVVFCLLSMYGLRAYDMDSKEVSVVPTSSDKLWGLFVPYIPYFSESPALTNKN